MQQFPGIDRSLIEELVRLGYTKDEIEVLVDMLRSLVNNSVNKSDN